MAEAKLTHIWFEDVGGARTILPGVPEGTILRSLFRILKRNALCSIATVTAAGRPHINTAYFCYSRQLVLYFLSHPNAQHCRNLSRSPFAGVTIYSAEQPWGSPNEGVQLFGVCHRATGAYQREAERLYGKQFPSYRRWHSSAGKGRGREYRLYRLVVDTLKLLDERAIGDAIFAHAAVRRIRVRKVGSRRRRTSGCS